MSEQDLLSRVVCDPAIHHGEPTIRGTRVSVAVIVANLAEMGVDEFLTHFPQLTKLDIQAAAAFAAVAVQKTLVA